MICPKCRAEYVHGVSVCADCNVPLVDKLTERVGDHLGQEKRFAGILATLDAAEITLVRSILDGAGIDYYIKGQFAPIARPYEDPARLYICYDQLDDALEILADFNVRVEDDLDNGEGVDET